MKRPIFKHFAWPFLLLLAPQLWSADEGTDGANSSDPTPVETDADPHPSSTPLEPDLVEGAPVPSENEATPEPPDNGSTFADDAVVFETPTLPEDTPAVPPPTVSTTPSTATQPAASGSQGTPASEPQQPQSFTIAKQEAPKTDAPAQPEAEEVDECPITEDVEPLRPDIELSQNFIWILLGLFFGSIIGFILYQLLRNKKHKPHAAKTTVAAVVKDPLEEALRLLKEAKALLDAADAKPFAFTLTDAVRPYLSYVFELPAPECTTEEMLVKLPVCEKLTDVLRTHIADLLTSCDLIKFTPMAFDVEARTHLYQTAETIIQLSKQRREELIEEARKAALAAKEQQAAQQKAALKEKISTLAGMKSISTVTVKDNAAKSTPKPTATAQSVKKSTNPTNSNQRKQ